MPLDISDFISSMFDRSLHKDVETYVNLALNLAKYCMFYQRRNLIPRTHNPLALRSMRFAEINETVVLSTVGFRIMLPIVTVCSTRQHRQIFSVDFLKDKDSWFEKPGLIER